MMKRRVASRDCASFPSSASLRGWRWTRIRIAVPLRRVKVSLSTGCEQAFLISAFRVWLCTTSSRIEVAPLCVLSSARSNTMKLDATGQSEVSRLCSRRRLPCAGAGLSPSSSTSSRSTSRSSRSHAHGGMQICGISARMRFGSWQR